MLLHFKKKKADTFAQLYAEQGASISKDMRLVVARATMERLQVDQYK